MFSKSNEDTKKQAKPDGQATRTRNVTNLGGSNMAAPSIIGSDVQIEGNVKTSGELQLDGKVMGDINCGSLVMGETGSVKGLVKADNVTIRGNVEGEIRSKTVRLEKSAVVNGDVYHENLSVEAGAKLSGRFAHTDNPMDKSAAAKKVEESPSFIAKKAAE
ncbi:polymer-forming cytoskeletal protein [Kordiimonas sp. SCSIO 12610]|uniref:bactofilin family protein n=1 Tax=Kordiimonas sp. SCSIO 12610 TaxID=2829597 RepID=UPI00210D98BC|nr:polymer-forming cytoskeletal protein [Kordiimonas sp. SCSIO 12610]UTW53849.1 polymer-forming cytoskeletal protein [Kordiimonas sp. SCSIO 12610]